MRQITGRPPLPWMPHRPSRSPPPCPCSLTPLPGQCLLPPGGRRIPSARVYEDALTIAFMDLGQVNPRSCTGGHKTPCRHAAGHHPEEAAAVMQPRAARGQRHPGDVRPTRHHPAAGQWPRGRPDGVPLSHPCGAAPRQRWHHPELAAQRTPIQAPCRTTPTAWPQPSPRALRRRLSRRARQSARNTLSAGAASGACRPRWQSWPRSCCWRAGRRGAASCRWRRTPA